MFRKLILSSLIAVSAFATANAQIGIGTNSPNPAAQLDVTSTNKGLLIPRIALTADNVWAPLTATPTAGMMIYNTASAGSGSHIVTPGFYYWQGTSWMPVAQAAAAAPSGTATFTCGNASTSLSLQVPSGFVNGTSYSGYVIMPYTNGDGGNYPADGQIINGLTLTRSAGMLANGNGQIIYSLSGTYTGAAGSESFLLNLPGNSCLVTLPATNILQASSINCQAATAPAGTYEVGTALTGANTKTITVTPSNAGPYNITTNTASGITFTASGSFTAAQIGTLQTITLQGAGTPSASGVKTFVLTVGAQACSFNLTVTAPAVYNCNGVVNTTTVQPLINGTAYTGSITVPYTAGSGSAYPTIALTSNGLTLTRVAGVFAAGGGNVVYNLSGTYTGTSYNVSFVLAESGCTVYTGSTNYNLGSLNCNGGASGTYTYGVPVNASNLKSIIFSAATVGPYFVNTNTVNGISFSASGTITTPGVTNFINMAATGTPISAGTYTYTVNLGGQNCTFTVTCSAPAIFNCGTLANTLPNTLVNGGSYAGYSLTETYTNGNNAAYGAVTVGPIDGLTLSAPAGTFLSAGGSIVYALSGIYTGATNGIVSFTLPESGCVVNAGTPAFSVLNCGGAQYGNYAVGVPMTAANTKIINITATTLGSYNISTSQNGVTFAGTGVLSTTGAQTITLTATGTPLLSGIFNYTIIFGGQTCSFAVTYTAAATILCGSLTNTVSGGLVQGTNYSGTITVPYIAGNGSNYGNFVLGPTNGITLTRAAGTYSANGGNIIYTVSGTYSGTVNASQNFTLAEGCTVTFGQPDLVPGSLSCGGALTGTFQQGISASGNTKTIAFANTTAGNFNLSSTSNAGIFFNVNTILTTTGSQTLVLNASGTPNNFGTFTYTVTLDGQSCSFLVTIAPAVTVSCGSIVSQLPASPVTGTAYTGTVTEPYTAGNNQVYGVTTLSSNGLTLTRIAGTYAAGGGSVVYNISGTYTATTNGYVFTLPENNCVLALFATAVPGSLVCNSTPNGNYVAGVPMAGTNSKPVTIAINTGGFVQFSTNTVNGISFTSTQTPASGAVFGLNMLATGTPIAAGTFNFTLTAGGQSCTFPITFSAPTAFTCSAVTNNLSGPLVNGTPYNINVTAPYTGGSGGTYTSSFTGPVNGLTLVANAGTYATGSGSINYTVTGIYTGPTNSSVSFVLPESGCPITIGSATYTAGSLACSGTLSGTYQNQIAVTAANTKVITVDVATKGGYNISTNSVAGITFSATGAFTTTGPQTVTLVASGTVAATGTNNFTVTAGTQTCTFPVVCLAAVTINCSGLTNGLPGTLANGGSYTGTVTLPYTAGNGNPYPTLTLSAGGLTLTRVAGTYAAGSGNIIYNLTGIYTGATGTSVNFTLPDGGCVVTAGAAVYVPTSINCINGSLLGTYVQNAPMTAANTKTIQINITNPGPWTGSTGAVNGVIFAGSGLFTATGVQNAILTATGTPAAAGIFTYPITIAGQNCSFSVTYSTFAQNCGGITNALPAYLTNGATYTISSAVILPYTAGNGSAYTSTTVGSNGLTLTRAPGTYAIGGGTIVYDLSGTYAGGAGTTANFFLPELCTVTAGVGAGTSPNCSGALSGVYQSGVACTAANTKSIDVNFTTGGSVTINSSNINGISFNGTAAFATTGVHTIVLTATGTPVSAGTFTYTVTAGGQSCTFNVTFLQAATFDCSQISGVPVITLVSGAVYSGTITEPYTAGNNNTYPVTSVTSTGLTLTRTAGTYASGGGNVVYTLSGTANASNIAVLFTLPESGCLVVMGSPGAYVANSFSCGGQLSGTYASGTSCTAANTKTVSINVSIPGSYAVNSNTTNGVTFAASGSTTTTGQQDIILTATGMPVAQGSFNYQVSLGGQICSFAVNFQ